MKLARALAVILVLAGSWLEAAEPSPRAGRPPRRRDPRPLRGLGLLQGQGPRGRGAASPPRATVCSARPRRGARSAAAWPAVTLADAPLSPAYVSSVVGHRHPRPPAVALAERDERGGDTVPQVRALESLPFVDRVRLVRRFQRRREEVERPRGGRARRSSRMRKASTLDYGTSFGQVHQIKVPSCTTWASTARAWWWRVFDAGFDNLGHEAFATTRIVATRDFVNGDDDVADGGPRRGQPRHGDAVRARRLPARARSSGPAYAATSSWPRPRTRDSETPVEEDNWAAAAEWAEALGADVISSSLGYLDLRPPVPELHRRRHGRRDGHQHAGRRDGRRSAAWWWSTPRATRGSTSAHNTLGAPADGDLVLAVGAVDVDGRARQLQLGGARARTAASSPTWPPRAWR